MAKRYELNDQQWARIAEMLPGKKSDPGRTGKDNRLFINGVLWVLRSGAQWDELPRNAFGTTRCSTASATASSAASTN